MVKKRKTVKLSEKNRRIGDDHPKAKLTDEEIEEIRSLYDDEMYGYTALARKFNVPKSTIAMICRYERRNTFVARSKTVHITED